MKNTTLCYIEQGSRCLMLHRTKKANDENEGKWIGVGGKCEEGESPEDCLLREVREETGLMLTDWRYRGLVTFVSDVWPTEYMWDSNGTPARRRAMANSIVFSTSAARSVQVCHKNAGGVFAVTCCSSDTSARRAASASAPSRLSKDPLWANSPPVITG